MTNNILYLVSIACVPHTHTYCSNLVIIFFLLLKIITKRKIRLKIFRFIGLFSYGLTLAPWLGTLQAACVLHKEFLKHIFRLPQQFFDTTPMGRILSRFSKDTESLDSTLPELFDGGIWCIFEVILHLSTYTFINS